MNSVGPNSKLSYQVKVLGVCVSFTCFGKIFIKKHKLKKTGERRDLMFFTSAWCLKDSFRRVSRVKCMVRVLSSKFQLSNFVFQLMTFNLNLISTMMAQN